MAAAGFGGYAYYENQTMDPLLKANIAALASIEDIGQGEGGASASASAKMSENIQYSSWTTSDIFLDVDGAMKSLDCNYNQISCVGEGIIPCIASINIDCVVRL